MKDIKHIRCDFHLVTWVIAQGWELGVLGGGGGVNNLNFLNMFMWHIKLKRVIRGPGYTEYVKFLGHNSLTIKF